ncbi:hypothetical protein [Clostridium thermarum]|uniref:hypothetical protein n=1 Tax=Clostridium thermarum TaxID=1716543 RepID=UPI0013D30291|nr:hypothetical protein [Clostridium thermarum]
MERLGKDRVILRTISNLSFAGEICATELENEGKGVLIKTSPKSEIKIWCPENEIQSIIFKSGKILQGDELKNELGF